MSTPVAFMFLAQAAAAPAQPVDLKQAMAEASPLATTCKAADPADILVCGGRSDAYRIDPAVLAVTREAEGRGKGKVLRPGAGPGAGCVGPQSCGGGAIPILAIAIAVTKAAVAAAKGEDWRETFRTKPDEYMKYREAKARQERKPKVTIGVGALPGPR